MLRIWRFITLLLAALRLVMGSAHVLELCCWGDKQGILKEKKAISVKLCSFTYKIMSSDVSNFKDSLFAFRGYRYFFADKIGEQLISL